MANTTTTISLNQRLAAYLSYKCKALDLGPSEYIRSLLAAAADKDDFEWTPPKPPKSQVPQLRNVPAPAQANVHGDLSYISVSPAPGDPVQRFTFSLPITPTHPIPTAATFAATATRYGLVGAHLAYHAPSQLWAFWHSPTQTYIPLDPPDGLIPIFDSDTNPQVGRLVPVPTSESDDSPLH